MKKLLLLTITMLFIVYGFVTYVSFTKHSTYQINLSDYDVKGIYKSLVHFTPILTDDNGELKDSYYHKARKQADALKKDKAAKNEFLNWEELGPNNVGGRTRALLVDRNNSNLIYAGGVAGGLWISRNGAETWKPYAFNELLPVLSVGTITQDSDGLIYFSTGEPAHGQTSAWNGGFVPGEGIFKLTGPDAMFEQIESTIPDDSNSIRSQWARINQVSVSPTDPGVLFAALDVYGVQRSTNGGQSWSVPSGLPDDGSPSNKYDASDVEFDGTGKIIYASIEGRIYRSVDNNGSSFESLDKGVTADGEEFSLKGEARTELAVSPTNSNYVYVSYTHPTGRIDRIVRSTDGGNTWEQIAVYDPQFFAPFGSNNQGWYDHAIIVDPQNPDRIFFGGVTLWSWSKTDGWRKLDNFGNISVNPYYIHADKHTFEFDPTNPERLFVGGDGGVFRTNQASEKNPFFIPRNKNYNVTQFYSIGASYQGRVVAGAQDNGTSYIDYIGTSTQSANLISGGDGGYAEISDIAPNIIFASSQNLEFYRSANSGESFGSYLDPNCTKTEFFEGNLFITPYHLWEDFNKWKQDKNKYDQALANYEVEIEIYRDSLDRFNSGQITEEPKYVPIEPTTPKPVGVIYSGGSKIFAAVDALNVSGVSPCFILGAFNSGLLSSIGMSKDGKTMWAGSTNGELIRINGLDLDPEADPIKTGWRYKSSGALDEFVFTNTDYTNRFSDLPFAGDYITGVNINPNNINEVVVTTGGFGNASNIYLCTNARSSSPEFESIQGEGDSALPAMPVYEAIFDQSISSGNIIHAATELGIWTYRRPTKGWEEANEGIGRVRTLRIRQEEMNARNCSVIYIATHGRGAFRSAEGARNKGCDVDLPAYAVGIEDYAIEVKNTLNVYPNPISDVAKVDFNLEQSANINIRVLSMTGQLMQDYNYGRYAAGAHSLEIEKGNLAAGTYLMAMEIDRTAVISKQIVVVD